MQPENPPTREDILASAKQAIADFTDIEQDAISEKTPLDTIFAEDPDARIEVICEMIEDANRLPMSDRLPRNFEPNGKLDRARTLGRLVDDFHKMLLVYLDGGDENNF